MKNLLKLLLLMLRFLLCYCTIYYDDENTIEQAINTDEEKGEYHMLISGGYHFDQPLFDKYMVSIRTRKATEFFGDNHYCAGVIIGTRMIATAAHCMVDSLNIRTRPRRLTIIAGTPNRLYHTNNSLQLHVEEITIHPNFERNGKHDIALIRIDTDIPFGNPAVRIMSLATEKPKLHQTCTVAGWGQLLKYGPYAAKIVYAIVYVQSNETCKEAYGIKYDNVYNLCVSNTEALQRDTCYGDSGGPLVCASRLSGIIAWGVNCGTEKKPTVFTDIYSHRKWLYEVTNAKNCLKSVVKLLFVMAFCIIIMI